MFITMRVDTSSTSVVYSLERREAGSTMIRSHQPVSTADINRGASGWLCAPYGDAVEGDEVFHKARWPVLSMEGESYQVYSERMWEVA